MRQRVGLARAFALDPKVLLLDEPFGMLDSITRIELQEVLIQLWREDRKTALMVTHDVDEALFLSDRIVMMTNGPAARVGDILSVPFVRPRLRRRLGASQVLPSPRNAYVVPGGSGTRARPPESGRIFACADSSASARRGRCPLVVCVRLFVD